MKNKELNAYRAAAAVMIGDLVGRAQHGGADAVVMRVSPYGSVQPSEGGAFVELMLWVPDAALEKGEA